MNERSFFDSTISWGAILAGGVTAAAMTLVMLAFGVGAGLSMISPWGESSVSSTTAAIAGGVFLVATAMIASTFGGYIAGRLRPAWDDVHIDERFFRDTAHGFVTWAFATALSATILASAGTHIMAAASAGSIPAAGAGAAQAAQRSSVADGYLDSLLRSNAPNAQTGDQAATRAELSRIIAPATRRGGDIAPADRTYVAQVVASRTGLSQPDAEQRVNQVIAQAKDAADKARRAARNAALWLAASLLAGAFAASLAAAEGGKLRSSRWYDMPGDTRAPIR